MIGNYKSNLRVTWVSIGYYRLRIDRLTGASTTQLKSRVVDSIVCVLIQRAQRYFASSWSVPSAAAENCTALATWRSCLVSPFLFAFQSVSYFSLVQSVFSSLDKGIDAREICPVLSRRSLCWRFLSSFSESGGVARHFAHFLICTFRTNINDFHSRFIPSLNVMFDKSLLSQCNITLVVNLTIASSFLHLSRIIEHIFNGFVGK